MQPIPYATALPERPHTADTRLIAVFGAVTLGAVTFGLGVIVGSGGDDDEADRFPAHDRTATDRRYTISTAIEVPKCLVSKSS